MNKNYIYYDMQFNNVSTDLSRLPQLSFVDNRNDNILDSAKDYKMSIVRFQVDTSYLPSYICFIQPNQPNVNLSIYSVSLGVTIGGTKYENNQQYYLEWVPVNKNTNGEVLTGNIQTIENTYYWGYNCQYFLNLLNEQLKNAMTDLKGIVGGDLDGCNDCYFRWENNKVVLYSDSDFKLNVYFNKALYSKFSSFNLNTLGERSDGKHFEIIIDNYIREIINGVEYCVTIQEYDTVSNWTPVQSLLFTSTNMPMNFSLAGPSVNEINGYSVKVDGSNYSNVITDIQTNENFYKSNLIYTPSAEYRWISLSGDNGIKDVNINCFWKDKFGGIHPLRMMPGCSGSIKLLFQKV